MKKAFIRFIKLIGSILYSLLYETNTTLLGYFNKTVIGMVGVTVKDLIIMNLQ